MLLNGGNLVFQQGAGRLTPGSVSTVLNNAAAISADTYVPGSTYTNGTGMIQSLGGENAADVLWSKHDYIFYCLRGKLGLL